MRFDHLEIMSAISSKLTIPASDGGTHPQPAATSFLNEDPKSFFLRNWRSSNHKSLLTCGFGVFSFVMMTLAFRDSLLELPKLFDQIVKSIVKLGWPYVLPFVRVQ